MLAKTEVSKFFIGSNEVVRRGRTEVLQQAKGEHVHGSVKPRA